MPSKSSGSTSLKPSAAKVKPPPMYQVVMYNDDFTPMEFVVEVLQTFFSLTRERATQVMRTVSSDGRRRRWQFELRQQRRPPNLGAWFVESIGSSDKDGTFDIDG